jgi:hypothetical protein
MTTRKNVRRDALRRQQNADLRSLRRAFIATLPHGKETHGLASAMTLIDASIRAQRAGCQRGPGRDRGEGMRIGLHNPDPAS